MNALAAWFLLGVLAWPAIVLLRRRRARWRHERVLVIEGVFRQSLHARGYPLEQIEKHTKLLRRDLQDPGMRRRR
jgi:hypothetical protein